jgi:hypothetical protein
LYTKPGNFGPNILPNIFSHKNHNIDPWTKKWLSRKRLLQSANGTAGGLGRFLGLCSFICPNFGAFI